MHRRRVIALWAPLLTCVMATYGYTANRFVGGGDSGEFATMLAQGGVPHPPGYPLYVLYLRTMCWLPVSSPTHAAALATAVLGAAAVLVLLLACTSWGASAPAAAAAGAVFGFSPLAWRSATEPEAFALNALIAAGILALAGPACRLGVRTRLCMLGALLGLGLANHHSIVLLAPAVLWVALKPLIRREASPRELALFAIGIAVGLSPYAYTWHVATHSAGRWIWGDPGSAAGLLHHFVRGDYGTARLGVVGGDPKPLLHVGLLVGRTITDLWIVAPIIALAGTVWLFARRPEPAPAASRIDAGVLLLTALTAGPLFVSRFNIDPTGIGASVVERFYLLPELVVCIPLALGIDLAARHLRRRKVADGAAARPWIAVVVMAAAAVAGTFTAWPRVRELHRPTIELFVQNTLDSAPKDAVILGTGDHRLYGFLYAQHALGIRPDVVYLDPNMWRYRWYRRHLGPALRHAVYEPDGSSVSTITLAESLLATGRPLLVTNLFTTAIAQELPSYPFGTLIRVLPRGTFPPSPDEVERMNLQLDAAFRHELSPPRRPGTWASDVHEAYARPWFALATAFAAQGLVERSEASRARAIAAAPWLGGEQ